ncbi:MAG TPA: hypothetical protein VNT54_07770 [Solirubrobacteraceae bacterium]|nr:hypothetical protein [Solirubrobacteraceae bacterium]
MRKPLMALACVAGVTALVVAGPAGAKRHTSSPKALSGGVKISVHTHSNNDPVFPGLLFPSERLSYDFAQADSFSYSSRTCAGRAPFNEIGLDFRPDYPGIDDATGTAAVRHRAEGTVTRLTGNGDKGTIEGTITSVVCVTENGVRTESGDAIVSDYRAKFRRTSDNEVQLTGRFVFSPTESTGTFAGLTGGGSLKAILTCLPHVRDPSEPTCRQRGDFTDFVGLRGDTAAPVGETTPGMIGHYRDATVAGR